VGDAAERLAVALDEVRQRAGQRRGIDRTALLDDLAGAGQRRPVAQVVEGVPRPPEETPETVTQPPVRPDGHEGQQHAHDGQQLDLAAVEKQRALLAGGLAIVREQQDRERNADQREHRLPEEDDGGGEEAPEKRAAAREDAESAQHPRAARPGGAPGLGSFGPTVPIGGRHEFESGGPSAPWTRVPRAVT
jgi:hypothetical protein